MINVNFSEFTGKYIMKGVGVPMKRLLIGIMMIMTAVTVFTGCGNKEEQSSSESENTNTVEYFQQKLNGTFAGSNDTTYIFSDGKITQQYEKDGSQAEKKGSYTITEADSDNDGENDSVSLRLTINGNSSSYTLESDGDNIILTEGNRKTTLTKK